MATDNNLPGLLSVMSSNCLHRNVHNRLQPVAMGKSILRDDTLLCKSARGEIVEKFGMFGAGGSRGTRRHDGHWPERGGRPQAGGQQLGFGILLHCICICICICISICTVFVIVFVFLFVLFLIRKAGYCF